MSQATRGSPIRILMIGPEPPPVGGTTVLFRSLVEALGDRPGITVTVVNTVGVRGSGAAGPLRLLRLAWSVFRGMRGADVAALHVSTTGLHLLGPLAVCAARRSRIPLIIRKFGGVTSWNTVRYVARAHSGLCAGPTCILPRRWISSSAGGQPAFLRSGYLTAGPCRS